MSRRILTVYNIKQPLASDEEQDRSSSGDTITRKWLSSPLLCATDLSTPRSLRTQPACVSVSVRRWTGGCCRANGEEITVARCHICPDMKLNGAEPPGHRAPLRSPGGGFVSGSLGTMSRPPGGSAPFARQKLYVQQLGHRRTDRQTDRQAGCLRK